MASLVLNWPLFWQAHRYWWHWRQKRSGLPAALEHYIAGLPATLDTPLQQTGILALDLETTSLDPNSGEIIAIGLVDINQGQIELGSVEEILVKPIRGVGDSATTHQLTDRQLQRGSALEEALQRLLHRAQGRVLLCHHAPLDITFLKKALCQCFALVPPLPAIDTLALEAKLQQRQNPDQPLHQLRLHQCRARYHLPELPGHSAVDDARACAELFLAHLARYYDVEKTPIRCLL